MFNKGFSIIEAMFAIFIVTIILVTSFQFDSHIHSILSKKKDIPNVKDIIFSNRYKGYDTCFLNSKYVLESKEYLEIPFVTSAVGRSGYVFVTADSNVLSDPDLYIIKDAAVEAALSTGPGLRDAAVTRDFIYVANTSSLSQVQKINISNIENPYLVSSYKFASTGNAIRFDQNKIYIGAEKAYGPELAVLDTDLRLLYNYETNSQINDIYITDKVYVAASDINQLHIIGGNTFSPSGWETQQGKSIVASGTDIYFGRTVGGFNNKNNHELFLLGGTSTDIGTGVYGLVSSGDLLFVAGKDIQVWVKSFSYLYSILLLHDVLSLSCDKDTLIAGHKNGLTLLKFKYVN